MEQYLHIVCLDVPYPPDYGGVFDLFYKLRYLKELDVKIILHCFEYGRGRQAALDQYCEKVYYYKRKRGISSFSFTIPYCLFTISVCLPMHESATANNRSKPADIATGNTRG